MLVSTRTSHLRHLLRMAIGQAEIGRRIRQAREDADLTQQQLADRIGIQTAQSISRYERGETEVSTKRLRKIAEATGRDLDFFIQEEHTVGRQISQSELEIVQEELAAARGEMAAMSNRLDEVLRLLREPPEADREDLSQSG